MNIANDLSLSREAAKAAIMFYLAERARHLDDVSLIDKCVDKLMKRYELTNDDFREAENLSRKYVEF